MVAGEEATATTFPCSSINRALLEVVEVSMPRKYMFHSMNLDKEKGYPKRQVNLYTCSHTYRTPRRSSTVIWSRRS